MNDDDSALADDEFLARFLDASLPPSAFDHRGHLRAAWLCLQRQPLETAVATVCAGIAALAARLGAAAKYHRTLTEALVRLMHARGAAAPGAGFDAFLAAQPGLVADARALLARHYSPERLADERARTEFLAPDRLPLPA